MPQRMSGLKKFLSGMSPISIAPAIQPWFWSSLIALSALAILAGCYGVFADKVRIPRPPGFVEFNKIRFQKYLAQSKFNPDTKKVILIGSSRIKYATDLPGDNPEPIRTSSLSKFSIFRIARNGAVFEDFRPFIDEILRSHPDVIVVELNQLVLRRVALKSERYGYVREYLKWVIFGIGRWKSDFVRESDIQFKKPCSSHDQRRPTKKNIGRQRYLFSPDPMATRETLIEWFTETAARQGIRVIFLDIPTNLKVVGLVESRDLAIATAREKFGQLPNVGVLEFPHQLGDDMFCDEYLFKKHLVPSARAQFTDWLSSQIQNGL